jgi:hypothetical protein
MKKARIISILIVFCFSIFIGHSQEVMPDNTDEEFKGFYIGGVLSTNGWGAEAKYILNKRWTFRTGYEVLNYNYSFKFDENNISYDATMSYKTGGIPLLADFNFSRHFYVSGGVMFNSFNPKINGYATSDLQYGDITIGPEDIGDFKYTIKPELQVSPYGALGFRSFMGKRKRFVFNFEAGMYYLGSPEVEIEATGLLSPTANPAHGQKETFENQLKQYKFYPVLKLGFAVKLF